MIYRQQRIKRKLPTCQYSIEDLDDLKHLCERIHAECCLQFKDDLRTRAFLVKDLDADNSTAIDKFILDNFQIHIEVHGSKGEYLHVSNQLSINKPDLPYRIEEVRIRNDFQYEFNIKFKPSIYFDVIIDFRTQKIFDLISLPTHSTSNRSSAEASGINGIFVQGLVSEFESFFKKHSNLNHFINRENVYDIILWTGALPLLLFYLVKCSSDIFPQKVIIDPSPVQFILLKIAEAALPIQILFSIMLFFQTLLCFRLVFNFMRWFFPCQELTTQTSSRRKIAKFIFSTALAGVLGTIAYNLISIVITKLFS